MGSSTDSVKQIDCAGLLDRGVDLAVQLGGNSGHAARQNLAGFRGELGQQLRVGGDDLTGWDVVPAARHLAVRLTEIDTALNCFWLGHGNRERLLLAKFAVEGAALEEVIELHLLKTARREEALLVSRGDVT